MDTEDEEDSEPIFGFLEETLAADQTDKASISVGLGQKRKDFSHFFALFWQGPVNVALDQDEDDDLMFDSRSGGHWHDFHPLSFFRIVKIVDLSRG